jgi:NAD(P)-dependent dehydrogenase (short-subunit alcohol dehydrogenase family)
MQYLEPVTASPNFSLYGLRAWVIGGGSGIGRAISLGLGGAGATVGVAGRRLAALEETCSMITQRGGQARAFAADVADSAQLERLVDAACDGGRAPDVLVNAQGVMALKDSIDVDAAGYSAQMDVNVRSLWFASTRFGRGMLERGQGVIINIASMASFRGFPRNAVYAIGKHGVRAMTESLAAEWAPRGVRVNAIAPGFFITDLNREAMTEARRERALARIPMGRFGALDELAGAAVFLASPAAAYITGVTLPVDGGFLSMAL